MAKSPGVALLFAATCAVTLVGHGWLNWRHEQRIERLLSEPTGPFCEILSPPPLDEMLSNEGGGAGSRPIQLASSLLEAEELSTPPQPADALQPSPKPVKTAAAKPSRQQLEDEAAVREVIEAEMAETSAEERDIWFEELKSLPAEAVRDMLQVRKHLRVLTPDHHISGPGQLPPLTAQEERGPTREVLAEPTGQFRAPHRQDWRETREALRHAIGWSFHNLANAATPGYKRTRVVLGDSYMLSEDHIHEPVASSPRTVLVGSGSRVKLLHVDLKPGQIVETGRELDVAIDGEGFFVVQHETTERTFYTRCGTWALDSQRRVSQLLAGEKYLLDPPIAIPPEAVAVEISAEGVVSVRLADQAEKTVVGQIHLVRFDAPTELTPHGNCLFFAPPHLPPRIEADGRNIAATLKQRALEQSNVKLEVEQAERESWESILQAIPSTDIPRTARQGMEVPQ